jgi:hypothetical protein
VGDTPNWLPAFVRLVGFAAINLIAVRGAGGCWWSWVPGQRYRAVLEVLEEGASVTEVARRYGVARQTMQEWLARYASGGGLAGLADRSSRPASCPHQMSAVVEARVVGLRRDHPGGRHGSAGSWNALG